MAERSFIGPLTERQQFLTDWNQANRDLNAVEIPEPCRGCEHIMVKIFSDYSEDVAKGKTDLPTATAALQAYIKDCKGLQYREGVYDAHPTCPIDEAKKRSYSRH